MSLGVALGAGEASCSQSSRRRSRIAHCARRARRISLFAEVSTNRISSSRYHARRDVARSRIVLGPLAGSYGSRGVVTLVAAPVYGCVKGRSVERDNMQLRSIALSTTGYLRSSSPYHPHGAPIFPIRRT
jgi:hypothetical protein